MPVNPQFRQELETLCNRYGMEKGSDTPDFLLARYLVACLEAFDTAVTAREQWYGRTTQGVQPVVVQGDGTL